MLNLIDKHLEEILDLLPAHVYWKDARSVYHGCNQSQATDIGLSSKEQIIGKTDYDFSEKDVAAEIIKIDKRVIKEKKAVTIEESSDVSSGAETFLSNKIPLFDESGEVVGVFGISFNISQLKTKERTLSKEKETLELTLESIMSNMPGHVYWKNLKGEILGCNEAQAKSLKMTRERVIGKTAFDTLPAEEAEKINKIDQQVISTGQACTADEHAVDSDKLISFREYLESMV